MIQATFTIPPKKLKKKRYWVGRYWEMFGGVVVLFSAKPRLCGKGDRIRDLPQGHYEMHDNRHLIVGTMAESQFNEYFGIDLNQIEGKQDHTEMTSVHRMELVLPVGDDGKPETISFDFD